MSRIDAAKIAIEKAKDSKLDLKNTVMASDAFFPFADCITLAASQRCERGDPFSGSINDQQVIDEVNKHSMFMLITKKRHFNH